MSYLQCPHCEEKISVFGESHIEELAEKEGLELLAKLPIEPGNAAYMDAGCCGKPLIPVDTGSCSRGLEGDFGVMSFNISIFLLLYPLK